jgi:hypothetical protein
MQRVAHPAYLQQEPGIWVSRQWKADHYWTYYVLALEKSLELPIVLSLFTHTALLCHNSASLPVHVVHPPTHAIRLRLSGLRQSVPTQYQHRAYKNREMAPLAEDNTQAQDCLI